MSKKNKHFMGIVAGLLISILLLISGCVKCEYADFFYAGGRMDRKYISVADAMRKYQHTPEILSINYVRGNKVLFSQTKEKL